MSDPQQHPIVVQSPGVIGFAGDTVGALKSTPILLVMVLLNCAFIAGAAFYLRNQQENAYKLVDKMLDRCLSTEKHSELSVPPARPYTPTPDQVGDVYPPSILTEKQP
jgi:hypothetical protein